MALLDAVRALSSFSPPATLPDPEVELQLLAEVLAAHGLAPLASYQVEHTRLGAGLPEGFREKLLGHYQATANDNVLKLVTLRGALKLVPQVPVVLLEGAAFIDWLYPHMVFRPVGEVRFALRSADAPAFQAAVKDALQVARTEHEGRTAVFTDGKVELVAQEGLFTNAPADGPLFERRVRRPAFGPGASRPSAEDAVLAVVGEQAVMGLLAPLVSFVDLRELLKQELDAAYVRTRAADLGLSRGLYGACRLVSRFFPEVEDAAARLAPAPGTVERLAVDRVVEAASDVTKLRHLRGVDAAMRAVVSPW